MGQASRRHGDRHGFRIDHHLVGIGAGGRAVGDPLAGLESGDALAHLLRRTYRVQPGDTILFHAAAGGVGLIATQWAKHLAALAAGDLLDLRGEVLVPVQDDVVAAVLAGERSPPSTCCGAPTGSSPATRSCSTPPPAASA
jgi:hypothetical protein